MTETIVISDAFKLAKQFFDDNDLPEDMWPEVKRLLSTYELPLNITQVENDVISAVNSIILETR